ncbi:MAG: MtnX-like HAD-IB family phosphatase [Bacteroidota bacterium]
MQLKIFCDFDGTVSQNDVGNLLFKTLGNGESESIVQLWRDGKISSYECLRRECETVPPLKDGELESFVESQALDPAFPELVRFCKERGIELTILSDGLDYYIDYLLKREGITDVPFFANHLELTMDRRLVVSFPYTDEECTVCANCKRNHMLAGSGEDDIIVFIGDGKSDQCAVQYADVIFAKRALAQYCNRERIPFYPFQTLHDVVERLEKILARKRLWKRWRAELNRRSVFQQG